MNTRHILSNAMRPLVVAACVVTATGCGSDLLRTGRSPSILLIRNISGAPGGEQAGEFASNLRSDVQVIITRTINGQEVRIPTIFNDLVRIDLEAMAKDQSGVLPGGTGGSTSPLNSITVTRYRITFRRSDGQEYTRRGRAIRC